MPIYSSDFQSTSFSQLSEEWNDNSDNSIVLDRILQDPSYKKLFSMDPDIIKDQSGSNILFTCGHHGFRTDDNCFLLGLHVDCGSDVISQLISSLEKFDGSTAATITHSLNGLLVCFPDKSLPLKLLQKVPWLKLVERDSIFKASQIQNNAPWGLSRISNPSLPISHKFGFRYTGSGVDVYVMDSGVNSKHQEFGNRAKLVKSFYSSSEDCAGHGTETASVIAGTTVGVAKLANIKAIKVLDCSGNGKNSDLIRGLDYILQEKSDDRPAVINMSLGGNNRSAALDAAIAAAVERGIPVVVAAGNEDADACMKSPAGNSYVLTVGATTPRDARSSYSNWGACVNLFAPGDKILAASNIGNTDYSSPSGTSLSAPFVSGIVAQLLQQDPYQKVTEVYDRVLRLAAKDKLDSDSLGPESSNVIAQAAPYDPNDPTVYVDLNPSSSTILSVPLFLAVLPLFYLL